MDELRNRWLNPPEWTKTEVLEFPGSLDGPWARYIDTPLSRPGEAAAVPPLSRSGRGAGGEGTSRTSDSTYPHPSPLPQAGEGGVQSAHPRETRRSTRKTTPDPLGAATRPHPSPLPEGEGAASSSPRVGTVRWPRVVPKDPDCAESLKRRTLTNLYNERPTWLDLAHRKLDEAVFAAYGWDPGIADEELLERLLRLNLERAGATE